MRYLLFILSLCVPALAIAQPVISHVSAQPQVQYDTTGTALADSTNHALRIECISNTCGGGSVTLGTTDSTNLASTATYLSTLAAGINNPLAAQTTQGVLIGAVQGTSTPGTSATANVFPIQGCATCVPVPVTGNISQTLGTTNGWTPLRSSALSTTVVSVKSSAGQLGELLCYNPNSSAVYVQIFNVASGSVTLGSTSPVLSIPIAPQSTGGLPLANPGINFSTAISIAATTTATGSTAASTAPDCNEVYN
jgi:hypothetical protein